ncbi:MAG: ATP-dependent DNA helicase RecG [Clostridiaceae bacterium]|nr:ATP-dependent DNA helicase RecG [Clostridiaceae bacterium]
MTEAKTGAAGLAATPISTIKGISVRRTAALRKLGIETWYDLITWFPRGYEDWSPVESSSELQDGLEQTFIGAIARKPQSSQRGRLSVQKAVVRVDSSAITAVWFNQPWLIQKLDQGQIYIFHGKIKRDGRYFTVQNPSFDIYDEQLPPAALKPLYPLTEGISQAMLRLWISTVLSSLKDRLPEPLPDWVRRDNHLCAVDYAINKIHQPLSAQEAEMSRYRLAFEELFLIQGGLRILKQQRLLKRISRSVVLDQELSGRISQAINQLPFDLTAAQKRTIKETLSDMQMTRPMNRLVQGDVGSGKTVVAAMAMYACALAGGQAVMMAPTSVLAAQHFSSLTSLLADCDMEIALLTGQTTAAKRREILASVADGSCHLLVGTHALLEDRVVFNDLLLTVTDEQHRFGVRQRSKLAKAEQYVPHNLVMSATPIPRTLGLILYGDLDISVIDELPKGRQPIETYTATSADRKRVYDLMRKMTDEGRQVYVICPMIEEDSENGLASAVGMFNELSQNVFPDIKVGLLHGALKPKIKDEVMQEFYEGHVQILVSTTVVEVGVDQPNAAMMVIENAERFGLAQLHQLRGRIGRGPYRSICVLLSDNKEQLARERLKTLCHSQDGFIIAEKDLELRGPGDFFGTRQHGLPIFKLANLYDDRDIIAAVGRSLDRLFEIDPELEMPQHRIMIEVLHERYGDAFPDLAL